MRVTYLVERLLTLLVGHARDTAVARGALLADGVDLVDEDDARRLLARRGEQRPHAPRPQPHKQLHKLCPEPTPTCGGVRVSGC